MQNVNKHKLSGSTGGRRIKISATTAEAAQTVATAQATGTDAGSVIYLDAVNHHTAAVDVYVLWGGTTAPDDLISVKVPSENLGAIPVHRDWLQDGLLVKVYASVANVITIGSGGGQLDGVAL